MVFSTRLFSVVLVILFLAGCAAQPRYTWCKYDCLLYDHYKNPVQNEEFIEALKEAVLKGEAAGQVPPGIYAEYGYVLYEQGNNPLAIQYFQKEADKWPESRVFMAKMITNVQKGKKIKDDKSKPAPTGTETKQTETPSTEVSK
jgi:hypothetical protein